MAEAVRTAYGEKTAVYPIGGGTGLDYGARPTAAGHRTVAGKTQPGDRLSARRHDDHRRSRHDHGRTFQNPCRRSGSGCRSTLHCPIGRPSAALAAVNPSGPRRFAYGTMRDYVLGFTAVDGQGTIFSGGGRVVKNAAGYNMGRLMVGSLGTLGVDHAGDADGPPRAGNVGPGGLRPAGSRNRRETDRRA